tara:strand:- start:441 stop:2063 length:1623 start_codon:yes stop_codon:yes gene_type:complete
MEILLIVPRYNLTNKKSYNYSFPSGLGYISSVIKNAGHNLDCINLNHFNGTVEQLVTKALNKKRYDIVCSGHIGIGYAVMEKILLSIRNHQSKPKFILGGPIITSAPKLIFDALKPDFAVIGEGEITILELLKHLKEKRNNKHLKDINGIIYRDLDKKIIITSPRKPIENLDTLPLPDLDGLEFEKILDNQASNDCTDSSSDFPRNYIILCSRGCPFQCTFCYHCLGTKYRTRSTEDIIKELRWAIKKYKINFISIFDDLFSVDKNRLYDFCKKIKLLFKEIPWKCEWSCQLSVRDVDREMMSIIKDAGCTGVSWGFESYSLIVLRSMKKPITPEQIDKAIKLCMEFKINIRGNFIFGDIAETKETAKTTLDYCKNNCKGQASVYFIQPYPGSAIYNHCIEKEIIKDELDYIKNKMAHQNWLNMTESMTDLEILELKKEILKVRRENCKYIIPLKISKEKEQGRYLFKVKCPFCNEKIIYKNCKIQNRLHYHISVFCKNCHMFFYISSKAYKFGMDNYNALDFFRRSYLSLRDNFLKKKL